ncbi:hypothetical protein RGC78_08825 [Clostridium sp. 5N-1]|uniref:Four helix bundle protein n=1 Tax=Clostridium aquiflavi TaxID=3073603 RepID=A0ABU1EGQ3_9CLOT|nr:hypothetical protein [Clostridium sp. 5N-1]
MSHNAVGELLKATDYISIAESKSIIADCNKLNTMLVSIVKTTKENLRAIGK